MTLASLAQAIRHLPSEDQARLFDRLTPSLEDYLLAKIASDRFKRSSHKRISWAELKH
jgi:hypothetical protein